MSKLVYLLLFSALTNTVAAETASGHWEGKVKMPNRELELTLDLAQSAKGAWIGTITIPGTGTADVPLTTVAVDGATVKFTASLPMAATFEGQLSEDRKTMSGNASSSDGTTTFQLTRNGEAVVKLPAASTPLTKEFAGPWEGKLESDGRVRRVGLTLVASDAGTATGILIALDQNNLQIPATSVTIHDRRIQIELRSIGGAYSGSLNDTGEIAGEWSEGPTHLPLTFKRTAKQ